MSAKSSNLSGEPMVPDRPNITSSCPPAFLRWWCAVIALSLGWNAPLRAAEHDALTILELHCVKCHGGEKTKGGLDVVTREALLRGGDSGPVINLEQPETSLLLQLVRHEKEPEMPQKQRKLSEASIKQLAKWVAKGAPYTRTLNKSGTNSAAVNSEFTLSEAEKNHWAFQPISRPMAPKIRGTGVRVSNPIDHFIGSKLQAAGLSMAPVASREQLIRRVTLDLVGLPPTPKEVDDFVNDQSEKAYEQLIDRLLASKHYGERWGRHWLDLARYAETDGFEHDAVRPHSWRYRDYVIEAFNSDKPYDRFIQEQLAGDELWPEDPEALTATGFNLLGPDMVDSADQVQRRHNTLNDMTDTASLAFLGLTMGCARCHDHKLEPISQKDYYAMQAFFTSAKFEREKAIPTPDALAAHDAAVTKFREHPKVVELTAFEKPIRAKIFESKLSKLAKEAQIAHRAPPERRTVEQANLVLETQNKLNISEKEIGDAISGEEEKKRWKAMADAVKKLPQPPALPKAMVLVDGPSAKTFLLNRGEYSQPLDEINPAIPTVLQRSQSIVTKHSRAELARWLTSRENPLPARVMVNRIWQRHFGKGIVATPSDFGIRGAKPTHPELLDWLGIEFIDSGWSIKRMHKLMLMSATYQQTSSAPPNAADPENQLYSRMNRLRLEGEVIRDSLLEISAQLNRAMGGPGVYPPIPKELFQGSTGWKASTRAEEHSRRSIYIFARRNLRFPFLEVFDAPDNNLSCPLRERSTTAPQALTLLNADEVVGAASATAARLSKECRDRNAQVTEAYRLILGRRPSDREVELATAFLAKSPLEEFCRALFNLNQFVYVE